MKNYGLLILFFLFQAATFSQNSNSISYEKISLKYFEDSIVQKKYPFIDACVTTLNASYLTSYWDIMNYLRQKNRLDSINENRLKQLYKESTAKENQENIKHRTISFLPSRQCPNKDIKEYRKTILVIDDLCLRREYNGSFYVVIGGYKKIDIFNDGWYCIIELNIKGEIIGWVYIHVNI